MGLTNLTSKNGLWSLTQNPLPYISNRTSSGVFAVGFNCCSSPSNLIKDGSTSASLQTSDKNVAVTSLTSLYPMVINPQDNALYTLNFSLHGYVVNEPGIGQLRLITVGCPRIVVYSMHDCIL